MECCEYRSGLRVTFSVKSTIHLVRMVRLDHRLKFLMVKLIYKFNSKRGYGAAISNLAVYE